MVARAMPPRTAAKATINRNDAARRATRRSPGSIRLADGAVSPFQSRCQVDLMISNRVGASFILRCLTPVTAHSRAFHSHSSSRSQVGQMDLRVETKLSILSMSVPIPPRCPAEWNLVERMYSISQRRPKEKFHGRRAFALLPEDVLLRGQERRVQRLLLRWQVHPLSISLQYPMALTSACQLSALATGPESTARCLQAWMDATLSLAPV